jgi:hypothetical protein
MKSPALALLSTLLALPLAGHADRLLPAGSLIQCTVSEPRISSKTTAVGDPVLCRISHSERYGHGAALPYNSYLAGSFEAYKDPGHFIGKGWMELAFDRMVIEPNTIVPLSARVVDVPGYVVDKQGRIRGKGHAVRDTIEWSIPILWPIDLLMLPRRGPRPTLKEETRLTVKLMDDLALPDTQPLEQNPSGLLRRPSDYNPPPPPPDAGPAIASAPPPPEAPYPRSSVYLARPPVLYLVPMPMMYLMPPAQPVVYFMPPVLYQMPPTSTQAECPMPPPPQAAYQVPPPDDSPGPPPPQAVYQAPPPAINPGPPVRQAYYASPQPRMDQAPSMQPANYAPPPGWGAPRTVILYRNGYAYSTAIP